MTFLGTRLSLPVALLLAAPQAFSQTPCPNPPPVPVTGTTVLWSAAGSPYTLCDDLTIPAGASVVVEAGVEVDFGVNVQLFLEGELELQGTAGAPVRLSAPAISPPFIEVDTGARLEGDFALVEGGQIRLRGDSVTRLRDSEFASEPCGGCPNGSIRSDTTFFPLGLPFLELERCTFETSLEGGSALQLVDVLAKIRESRFERAGLNVLRGFVDLQPAPGEGAGPIEVIDTAVAVSRQESIQPLALDGLVVDGIASAPGLRLTGGNYALGSGVEVRGAQYPLRLEGGTPIVRDGYVGAAHRKLQAAPKRRDL